MTHAPAFAWPRAAGLLLHPSSLPGPHGIGDVGRGGRRFVDWLATTGLRWWQVLPLVPPGAGWSPYSSSASMAGNPWLLDLHDLVDDGLLDAPLPDAPAFPVDAVDFDAVAAWKAPLLREATRRVLAGGKGGLARDLEAFRAREPWVEDTALYLALREAHGGAPWWTWPAALRDRAPKALARARDEHREAVDHHAALQLLFDRQWAALRARAAERGLRIIGDLPIYVDRDSADVWADQALFRLAPDGTPEVVAGVPPDYFSETGQLWGNPLYRWDVMADRGFRWWIDRLQRVLAVVDVVRIDHFRAFSAFWEVPADAEDARPGRWVEAPGRELFAALRDALGGLPIIAEDLGALDDDVHALRDGVGLPGMSVLQFAFGGEADNAYLPHNHAPHAVTYTGTHDNDTTAGWWAAAGDHVRDHARRYLGLASDEGVAWQLLRAAFASVSHTAVVPLQDVLSLGTGARMNTPGQALGNWSWRVREEALNPWVADGLRREVALYGRDGSCDGGRR